MKSYIFKVKVEQDQDKWVAYYPELKDKGGAAWGETREDALRNLEEVIRLVLEDMVECGELSVFESKMRNKGLTISPQPLVSVTL
ncbi:MAG: type II toxin-antitoxin system HicB family antitoxin [Candidatus Altiarchaeales archaeon]|nr:type II toxin-antitoxin system HicB family antitoxin [Candidatus Altiarchaeales archaeon]